MEVALASSADIAEEKDLDRAIREIRGFARRSAEAVYNLGGALKRLRDEELWTLRIDKQTGKGKYQGFYDFCRAEIDISESYIRRLILINEQYSLKDLKKWGVARLTVSTRLPEYKRKDFLKRSKYVPACSKEFTKLARQVQQEEPEKTISKHFESPPEVTIPLPIGIQAQPMWVRPRTQVPAGEQKKEATSMMDEPWAKFKLGSDVIAYVRLARNDRGGITAMLEIRHGKDTADAE